MYTLLTEYLACFLQGTYSYTNWIAANFPDKGIYLEDILLANRPEVTLEEWTTLFEKDLAFDEAIKEIKKWNNSDNTKKKESAAKLLKTLLNYKTGIAKALAAAQELSNDKRQEASTFFDALLEVAKKQIQADSNNLFLLKELLKYQTGYKEAISIITAKKISDSDTIELWKLLIEFCFDKLTEENQQEAVQAAERQFDKILSNKKILSAHLPIWEELFKKNSKSALAAAQKRLKEEHDASKKPWSLLHKLVKP